MANRILILLLFSFFAACTNTAISTTNEEPMPEPVVPIRYLALGDSYTIGESVPSDKNYPNQLVTALRNAEVSMEDAQIIAKTGWTTDELNAAIQEASPDTTFHIVSLLIGVNNQFRGWSMATYTVEFEDLLKQAIRFANGDQSKVFVVSIPDYAYTPYGQSHEPDNISKGIDDFNDINRTITKKYNISYFDITPISRKGIVEPILVATDKLHPSGEQYTRWVELIVSDIQKMVTK